MYDEDGDSLLVYNDGEGASMVAVGVESHTVDR